jgi:hypothetical protein
MDSISGNLGYLQYFGHFLSERVTKKGHSWLNVRVHRYLQPGHGL